MSNDLVHPSELDGFPGGPFSKEVVASAVADLRDILGWHVAPRRTETITLDNEGGGTEIVLPSRKVVSVDEVRDVSGTTPTIMTGWRLSQAQTLTRGCWPIGASVLEVDLTHGHASVPADLLPVLAALCQSMLTSATAGQQTAGPFSVTTATRQQIMDNHERTLARHSARTL
jgi:hypothetical protein